MILNFGMVQRRQKDFEGIVCDQQKDQIPRLLCVADWDWDWVWVVNSEFSYFSQ